MVSKIGEVWYCKSGDSKPTGIARNGQELKEIDTGKIYHFDADTGEFVEWTTGGGE